MLLHPSSCAIASLINSERPLAFARATPFGETILNVPSMYAAEAIFQGNMWRVVPRRAVVIWVRDQVALSDIYGCRMFYSGSCYRSSLRKDWSVD